MPDKSAMGSKVLVVLGMHRSGTSLVTQWLHACGLHVGDALLGAGVGNVEGHFEDLDLYRLHRSWLEHNRLPHTGFVDAAPPPFSPDVKAALRKLVDDRNARFAQWGWKEPRTCLFLDEYRGVVPDARYLAVFRDFRETVSSMILRIRRQKDHKYAAKRGLRRWLWFGVRRRLRWRQLLRRDASHFVRVWVFYNRQVLEHLQRMDRQDYAVVRRGSLTCDDGAALFATLTRRWGFALDFVPFGQVFRAELASVPLDLTPWVDAPLLREAEAVQAELEALALAAPTTIP